MVVMKREIKEAKSTEQKAGLTEKEYIEYIEERFRKLKQDEQKFRNEALTRNGNPAGGTGYTRTQ